MANEVTIDIEIDAPAEAVFDYIADYTRASEWIYGLAQLEPLTEVTRGLGARFDGELHLGAKLHAKLEITEFVEGKRFAMTSYEGVKNASTWTVDAIDADHSQATLVWSFDLGGGLSGKALNKLVEPFIKIAAKHSSTELKKAVEAQA